MGKWKKGWHGRGMKMGQTSTLPKICSPRVEKKPRGKSGTISFPLAPGTFTISTFPVKEIFQRKIVCVLVLGNWSWFMHRDGHAKRCTAEAEQSNT